MNAPSTVRAVVDGILCVGCGACVGVCPRAAVRMVETPGGLLWADVSTDSCSECGRCVTVCPGWHLAPGLLDLSVDPFEGTVLAAHRAQATDEGLLENAQSGGAASAVLVSALQAGLIAQVAVTRWSYASGRPRPEVALASTAGDVLAARGSKYCPAPVMSVLPKLLASGDPVAVVGLPCHVHALRNAQRAVPELGRAEIYTVGLVCDRVLSYGAIDHLIARARLGPRDIADFQFRSKRLRGWPGDPCVRDAIGQERWLERTARMECKAAFTPARCHLCFDKMNVLADIVLGDGYGLRPDPAGVSGVLVRSPQGQRLLTAARDAGTLSLEPAEPEVIFAAQNTKGKRREWTAYRAVCQQLGSPFPDHRISAVASPTALELAHARREISWGIGMARAGTAERARRMARRRLWAERSARALSVRRYVGAFARRLHRVQGMATLPSCASGLCTGDEMLTRPTPDWRDG